MTRDPRSEAEKARADLKRNSEMGHAVSETPLTRQPSATPETFGEHSEQAHSRTHTDPGAETGSAVPGQDNDPKRGGYYHADTAMGTSHSESIAEFEQAITGRAESDPAAREGDADAPSRAKE